MTGEERISESLAEFGGALRGKSRKGRLWGNYVWLSYSVFYFVEPVVVNRLVYWLECLALYLCFLALYVWYVETRRPQIRLPLVLVIIAMGAATIHFNQGSSFFLIFGAALIPFAVGSVRTAVILLVGELSLVWTLWLLYRTNWVNFAITGFMLLAVGVANLFVGEQQRAAIKLTAAQQENVQLAAVAERERIARDLHDVLGHTLSVIVLKAELAGRLLDRDAQDPQARAEIADVETTARTALAEVREAIGGYRARGLTAEVENARRTLTSAGVALVAEMQDARRLHATGETALSLAVREAVTNIVRHAQATECTLRFGVTADGWARLEVADNGFAQMTEEGNGLRGMRERVEQLGGQMRIERGWMKRLAEGVADSAVTRTGNSARMGTRLVIDLPGLGRC